MTPESLAACKARTLDSLAHARRMATTATTARALERHLRRQRNAEHTLAQLSYLAERMGLRPDLSRVCHA